MRKSCVHCCNPKSVDNLKNSQVRFGICADIHRDIIHDADERLKKFIERMNREDVDFIIQLGDFCHPKPENQPFLDIWNQFKGLKYHVLGNHDVDLNDKAAVIAFLGMENNYYSYDFGDFHFIVLDGNYLKIDGKYVDYGFANFYRPRNECPFLSEEQLDWLEKDLAGTNKHTIIFSHQSMENEQDGINNNDSFQSILVKANADAGFQKVIACMNGHDHLDNLRIIDNINYFEINSMTYQWLGDGYECKRYTDEIHKKYPHLIYTVPYRDPLYAVVTLQPGGFINIDGVRSEFVGPSPLELGHSNIISGHEITPIISNRNVCL